MQGPRCAGTGRLQNSRGLRGLPDQVCREPGWRGHRDGQGKLRLSS